MNALANVPCNGCRDNSDWRYCMPDCFVKKCAAEEGVDFCGECKDFPCEEVKTAFPIGSIMYTDWLDRNTVIQKNGIEEYVQSLADKFKV